MRITFLGTGGAFCDYRVNYQNNALVETSAGPVLIDCGTTACQSLKELGRHPGDLQAVVFTHLHGDHASPEQLIWERYYASASGEPGWRKTPMLAPADVLDPLLTSLSPFLAPFVDRTGRARTDGGAALLQPERTTQARLGDLHITWFRVDHVTMQGIDKPAYGLWLEQDGVKVWWSGDTAFDAAQATAAARTPGCSRLFHECTFSPPYERSVHSHYAELLTLPEDVRAGMTLMHHTVVPAGVDVVADGFAGAADRHECFDLHTPAARGSR